MKGEFVGECKFKQGDIGVSVKSITLMIMRNIMLMMMMLTPTMMDRFQVLCLQMFADDILLRLCLLFQMNGIKGERKKHSHSLAVPFACCYSLALEGRNCVTMWYLECQKIN